ncbi:MBL fold metallo-hydrolase [Paenibacillus aceris]|uniref:Glyoxylase-like metal-dependent hydrolase (Beta-lactamase superfamily II) n=1 Tax=Paenibacillus aceris TaxID=869555 RepID=A0ABS4HSU3_9BACL|nr:MBL fold metallo-hydrolase [Paenibacillus aceris]MBP1961679.1 glyoxylase-like metal-dependent hydrolase (beta-lactamase superfamily II) [Paenibacillus aceris]NHW34460.1 MBL fold metallo-hydrolase [Paenibacillus aceris]
MQIANGIHMLELEVTIMGRPNVIYPTLLCDEKSAVLIDTGYPGNFPLICKAIEEHHVSLDKLNTIIISHQDIDHIGSLPTFLNEMPNKLTVLASELEKPYIEGEKMLIKVTPEAIDRAVASLPADVSPEWRKAFRTNLENPPKGQVHRILEAGEQLPIAGGLITILTPGHTPGHLSFYHVPSKTLIAADAMIVSDGQLLGPIPAYCADYELARQSLKKFTEYDIETVICYHGGLFNENANARISELVSTI